MPMPNGECWRRGRAKLDLTSDQAGGLLQVTGGALRSIENELVPVSLRLAYRAARLYSVVVDDLLVASDPDDPQTEPPDQAPQGPKSPKPQRKERAGKSPRRVDNDVRAAS